MAKFKQEIEIDAPIETSWAVLTDTSRWPLWFPDVDEVSGTGVLSSGSSFQWRKDDKTGTINVVEVDAERNRVKVISRVGDDDATHTFDLDHKGGLLGRANDSRLTYTMEYDPPGGFLGEFVMGANPLNSMEMKKAVETFKELAEGQAPEGS